MIAPVPPPSAAPPPADRVAAVDYTLAEHDPVDLATAALAERDPTMAGVIERAGPLRLRLETNRFRMICRAILSQQVSILSAKAIRLRFEKLLGGQRVTAARVAELSDEQLRGAGLTRQKSRYVRVAAEAVLDGSLPLSRLGQMTDEEAMASLTRVVGIGRWTAEMVLMFSLGRPDLFPVGDLGVRNAIAALYQVEGWEACETLAELWRPHRSVATYYLWRYSDEPRNVCNGLESYPV